MKAIKLILVILVLAVFGYYIMFYAFGLPARFILWVLDSVGIIESTKESLTALRTVLALLVTVICTGSACYSTIAEHSGGLK